MGLYAFLLQSLNIYVYSYLPLGMAMGGVEQTRMKGVSP